jgi:high-affinity iron transporter
MLPTALIVFREVLEASLIVSIVLAASRGVAGRGWWVGGGLIGGLAGAALLALFADALSNLASGFGQDTSMPPSCSSRSRCSDGTASG